MLLALDVGNSNTVLGLFRLATDGTHPELTIVLDLAVETGLERTRARVRGDRRLQSEQCDSRYE